MIPEAQRRFLLEKCRASAVPHSGRTLFAHLVGTYALLASWGNDKVTCAAGLFHSVYGTRAFKHMCVSFDRRSEIRKVIGDDAERLVYIFAVTSRPAAFLRAAAGRPLLDEFVGQPILLKPRELNRLLEIEAANLLEQGASAAVLAQIAAKETISLAARAAIVEACSLPPKITGMPPVMPRQDGGLPVKPHLGH